MKTPSEVHKFSERVYNRKVQDWCYDKDLQIKLVTVDGAIRWNAERFVMVSTALSDRYVGVEEIDPGLWVIIVSGRTMFMRLRTGSSKGSSFTSRS